MARRSLGIVMNGVTGRMGRRRLLLRSILAMREQGGLRPADGTAPWPEPVLVGRDAGKVRALAERHGPTAWTTGLAAALERSDVETHFDAQVTSARAAALRAADAPFPWDFHAGARGVRLAEPGTRARREGRRLDVPELGR